MVVDAHAHLWPAGAADTPAALEDLCAAMQAAGVSGAVLVQPQRPAIALDYLHAAALAEPERFAVVARVEAAQDTGELRLPVEGVSGYRLSALEVPELFQDRRWWPAWERMLAAGQPVCLLLHPEQLVSVRAWLAALRPTTPIVIDHLARLTLGTAPVQATLPALITLAELDCVRVKFSGLASLSRQPRPYPDLRVLVAQVLAAFGPERVLWGSDFPYLGPAPDYAASLAAARTLLSDLAPPACAAILGANARRMWWPAAGAAPKVE